MGLLELLIIMVIVLIIFGPSRLAGLGKGLGEGIKNFKSGISGNSKSDEERNPRRRENPR